MRTNLELLAGILVDERPPDDGKPLDISGQRHRSGHFRACALSRFHDLPGGLVKDFMVIGLEPDANALLGHTAPLTPQAEGRRYQRYRRPSYVCLYFSILVTAPAPTVRPPSRM